jgi:hypothetical protein
MRLFQFFFPLLPRSSSLSLAFLLAHSRRRLSTTDSQTKVSRSPRVCVHVYTARDYNRRKQPRNEQTHQKKLNVAVTSSTFIYILLFKMEEEKTYIIVCDVTVIYTERLFLLLLFSRLIFFSLARSQENETEHIKIVILTQAHATRQALGSRAAAAAASEKEERVK